MKLFIGAMLLCAMALIMAPAEAQADEKINARCASEWAGDYRMQKYCRDKEATGKADVSRFVKKYGLTTGSEDTPQAAMLRNCSADWTDEFGPHWRMLAYCLKKQEDAYRTMQ